MGATHAAECMTIPGLLIQHLAALHGLPPRQNAYGGSVRNDHYFVSISQYGDDPELEVQVWRVRDGGAGIFDGGAGIFDVAVADRLFQICNPDLVRLIETFTGPYLK